VRRVLSGLLDTARVVVVAAVSVSLLAGALWLRGSTAPRTVPATTLPDQRNVAEGGSVTPVARLASAAQVMTSAMGAGGAGFNFFAIQRNTEYAKPLGPKIAVMDPADQRTVIGETDQLFVNAMMSRGFVTSDGYFMEMHLAKADSTATDFATAPKIFAVLQQAGKLWRDDGQGWYPTDESPGMGIDPTSLRLLPAGLTKVNALKTVGTTPLDGIPTTEFSATASIDDYPGAVAADGKTFTEATFPVLVWLDGQNRVVQLVITARNLNQTEYDLVSETTITFDYGPAAALPAPAPTMAPEPLPSEPAAATPSK
jgi:hypothetical protein